MKFTLPLTFAILSVAVGVGAIAVPADASTGLEARDTPALSAHEATFIGEDFATAVLDEHDEDDFSLLHSPEAIAGGEGPNALAIEARDLEARGLKTWIINLLLKKMSKTKLARKVWSTIPAAKRNKISKYVKAAKKKGRKGKTATKNWVAKEVKPVVLKIVAKAIGTKFAKKVVNDVVPWVVNYILFVMF